MCLKQSSLLHQVHLQDIEERKRKIHVLRWTSDLNSLDGHGPHQEVDLSILYHLKYVLYCIYY